MRWTSGCSLVKVVRESGIVVEVWLEDSTGYRKSSFGRTIE